MGAIQFGQFESKSIFTEGKFTIAFAEYTAYAEYSTGIKEGFFIHLVNVPDGVTDEAKFDHQWITAGKLDFTAPSKDGKIFVDLESANVKDRCGPYAKTMSENGTGIPQNTNAEFWFEKLLDAGFDRTRLSTNINDVLSGVVYHAVTIDQPSRDIKDKKGFVRAKNEDGSEKKPTIKVPDKILSYDGDTTAAPAGAINYSDPLATFLTTALAGGPVTMSNLNSAMIKAVATNGLVDGDKAANAAALPGMITLCTPEWLTAHDAFTLDGDTVSLDAIPTDD